MEGLQMESMSVAFLAGSALQGRRVGTERGPLEEGQVPEKSGWMGWLVFKDRVAVW